jgi:hypothetical protein
LKDKPVLFRLVIPILTQQQSHLLEHLVHSLVLQWRPGGPDSTWLRCADSCVWHGKRHGRKSYSNVL